MKPGVRLPQAKGIPEVKRKTWNFPHASEGCLAQTTTGFLTPNLQNSEIINFCSSKLPSLGYVVTTALGN